MRRFPLMLSRILAVAAVLTHGAQAQVPGQLDPNFQPPAGLRIRDSEPAVLSPDGLLWVNGVQPDLGFPPLIGLRVDGSVASLPPFPTPAATIGFLPNDTVIVGGITSLGRYDAAAQRLRFPSLRAVTPVFASLAEGRFFISGVSGTGTTARRLVRFLADGSVDPTFAATATFDNGPYGGPSYVLPMPDGKVVVAGAFVEAAGVRRVGFARFLADGALDANFNPTAAMNLPPSELPIVPVVRLAGLLVDGSLVAAFQLYPQSGGDSLRAVIARWDINGVLDPDFHPPAGLAAHVRSGVVESDGAILVGGDFLEVEGQARSGLARLQKDGGLDPAFAPVVLGGVPVAKVLYPDGWLLVGGEFSSINGQAVTNVARVFNRAPVPVPPGVRPAVSKVMVSPGETAQLETTVTGWPPPSLQWRRGEVSLEGETNRTLILPAVNADRAGTYTLVASSSEGTALATMDLVVALRSPAPGQVDPAASVTLNPLAWVMAIVPLADGRFLLGGRGFQDPGDTTGLLGRVLTRILPDGSPDPTFAKLDPVDFPDPQVVRVILPTEGGSYYVGGNLRNYQGRTVSNLIRIGQDGQLDLGFAPTLSLAEGSEAGVLVTTVQHLGDGRIAVGGQFDTVNGKPRKGVAILRKDGSLDEGFNARLAASAEVRSLRVLPGGRILVGGGNLLDATSGVPEGSRNLVRLAPNGGRDPEFISDVGIVDALVDTEAGGHVAANRVLPLLDWILPGGGRDPGYQSLNRLRPDLFVGLGPLPLLRGDYGDVYVGIGPRASLDNVGQVGLAVAARLPASGIVDVSFAPTGVPAGYTTALAWNAEGRLVAASMVEGQALSRLYVFRPDPDQVLAEPRVVEGQFRATLATLPGRRYALETRSPDLAGPWQRVEEFEGDGFVRALSVSLDGTGPRFVRVQRIR
ncbi:MAG: hypothetical protein U1G08_02980 [Verrucomicrobiota bacterium]